MSNKECQHKSQLYDCIDRLDGASLAISEATAEIERLQAECGRLRRALRHADEKFLLDD